MKKLYRIRVKQETDMLIYAASEKEATQVAEEEGLDALSNELDLQVSKPVEIVRRGPGGGEELEAQECEWLPWGDQDDFVYDLEDVDEDDVMDGDLAAGALLDRILAERGDPGQAKLFPGSGV